MYGNCSFYLFNSISVQAQSVTICFLLWGYKKMTDKNQLNRLIIKSIQMFLLFQHPKCVKSFNILFLLMLKDLCWSPDPRAKTTVKNLSLWSSALLGGCLLWLWVSPKTQCWYHTTAKYFSSADKNTVIICLAG